MVGMSNNLVSESVTSSQMAQLEPTMNKADGSMALLRPVSTDSVSQNQGASNGEPMSQGLPLSNRLSGHEGGGNMGMHRVIMQNKQSMQMGAAPNNLGPHQVSAAPKRKATMELPSGSFITPSKREKPMPQRPWMPQGSNSSTKISPRMQSSSNPSRVNHSAASGKRKTQADNTSGKPATPRSSNSKNQNAQLKESSKVQTESSESVRSKMRESLAAALALVSQQDKPPVSNDDKPNNAANSSQCAGSASASADTAPEQKQEICQPVNSSLPVADSVDHVMGEEHLDSTSTEGFSEKPKDYQAGFTNVSNNEDMLSSDKQDFQSNYTLTTDDVPFSDSFFVKDELLQGNGLSWVLSDMDHMVVIDDQSESQTTIEKKLEPEETGGVCREVVPLPELLASRIEAELFKLFGGVNKKYKEKGRSLLFNLKDRNNPELRERVMFGKILPEQLCSMTAEELASKELSEWRIAKAEEFDKIKVLPDSDVDIRRLVRKTHKGEFQVEVEHEDNVPVEEVSGGKNSVVRRQPVKKDVEGTSPSKPDVVKSNVNTDNEKSSLQTDNQFSITISSNDGTDPMEGLMTDDDALKDPNFLPPIVSLDEFMESLNSEPPFENLPVESGKAPISEEDVSGVGSKSKSSDLTPSEQDDVSASKSDKLQSTDAEEEKKVNADAGSILSDAKHSESRSDTKPTDGHTKEMSPDGKKSTSDDAELRASQFHAEERHGKDKMSKTTVPIKGECLWEGMLQPNISTTDSVISIFKSGEKTSTKDWPGFLEIKGRVRLDAFEKFLRELPQSRSRAIMVSHFISKGMTPEEQATLREVADSYILDERVGFAEPVHGVELYFCPPHKKTVEMLSKILPKEQIEAVNSIDNGLIGIIVWRKTNITTSISPTAQSHHKHSSKRQNLSRRQQDTNVNANSTHNAVPSMGFKTTVSEPPSGDDDDVPPGFGPPVARVEDDLPEYNFSGSSNPSSHLVQKHMGPSMVTSHSVVQTPSRPAQQMRELVHKYGQNKTTVTSVNWQDKFGGSIQPWNDDDDDIPEWQPQINNQNQFPPQQTMNNFHLRPHVVNQSFPGLPQQPIMPTQYLQPPMNVTHVQQNFGPQWVPSIQGNNTQPSAAPPYGTPTQGTTPWSQHVSRSRRL